MMQTGLLDWQIRFKQLDKGGDPLLRIQTMVDWKRFRPLRKWSETKSANPVRVETLRRRVDVQSADSSIAV